MKRFALPALLLVSMLSRAGDGRIPIASAPVTLSQSGVYYLTQDLPYSATILIDAKDVVIDLAGHALGSSTSGAFLLTTTGASAPAETVTIRNGTVYGSLDLMAGGAIVVERLRIDGTGTAAKDRFSGGDPTRTRLSLDRVVAQQAQVQIPGGFAFASIRNSDFGIFSIPLTVTNARRVEIRNSDFEFEYGLSLQISAVERFEMADSRIDSAAGPVGEPILSVVNCGRTVITGSRLRGAGGDAIRIRPNFPDASVVVKDNVISRWFTGIDVDSTAPYSLAISGNEIDSFLYGISANLASGTIEANRLRGPGGSGAGIRLTGSAEMSVSRNHAARYADGILATGLQRSIVTGNQAANCGQGIRLAGDKNQLIGNRVIASGGFAIDLAGATNTYHADNKTFANGFNGVSNAGGAGNFDGGGNF